jgi:ABC transporter ATM
VFVAHRLRTISDSDQILVLKEGHVAETGSHRELLERDGIYAELWNSKSLFSLRVACLANSTLAQEQSMDQDVDLEQDQGDVQPKA